MHHVVSECGSLTNNLIKSTWSAFRRSSWNIPTSEQVTIDKGWGIPPEKTCPGRRSNFWDFSKTVTQKKRSIIWESISTSGNDGLKGKTIEWLEFSLGPKVTPIKKSALNGEYSNWKILPGTIQNSPEITGP